LCPILGYGTIKLKEQTSDGVKVITLRNQAYSPSCAANIIGQGDLVKQGFTFVRGKEVFVKRDLDDLRIDMTIKQSLTFWNGVPLQSRASKREILKRQHVATVYCNCGSSNLYYAIDRFLNDATLTNSHFRRTLVRKRAAELGCYISDSPKTTSYCNYINDWGIAP
jgi:hypothetical protein